MSSASRMLRILDLISLAHLAGLLSGKVQASRHTRMWPNINPLVELIETLTLTKGLTKVPFNEG